MECNSGLGPDVEGAPPPKKHKKHKHKKHKKKKDQESSQTPSVSSSPIASIPSTAPDSSQKAIDKLNALKAAKKKKIKGGGGKESGTSSDEERWLDAIQSGKLEEVDDELKKIKPKDPKLMTPRQRAMLERKGDASPDPCAEQLLSLPSGYREKVMTPEMMKKAALKATKRKQLLDEKREKDKKRTMERLLKKQDNKSSKLVKKSVRKMGATVCYSINTNGIALSLPLGMDFPLQPQMAPQPPAAVKCGVQGCENLKKYACSKTKIPLCSLKCYKANLLKCSQKENDCIL